MQGDSNQHMIRLAATGRMLAILTAALLVLWAVFPFAAYAQQGASDLRATIQSALLSDPRTSGLSQSEIEGIVGILADEAGKRGMTVEDIQWRPQNTTEDFSSGNAGTVPDICGTSLLCAFNEAFGFVGPDTTIPYILGAASMGLIWIFAEMLHRRRYPYSAASTKA